MPQGTFPAFNHPNSVVCAVLLSIGLRMEVGNPQVLVIAAGTLLAGSTAGPASAMVAKLTKATIHGTAFATHPSLSNLILETQQ